MNGLSFPWRVGIIATLTLLVLLAGGAWWLTRERCRLSLAAHTGAARSVGLSGDGTLLASGGGDGIVRLWQLPAGRSRATLSGHKTPVTAVALTGEFVAAGANDGVLKMWTVADARERCSHKAHKDGVTALVFAPDGKTLYSAGGDRLVCVWDVGTGKEQARLAGHTGKVWALALSPDGRTLASAGGGDNTIRLWLPHATQPIQVLRGHTRRVTALAFAPGGRSLLSSDKDGQLLLWDVASGKKEELPAALAGRVIGLHVAGDEVIAATEDRGLSSWPFASPSTPMRWPHRGIVHGLAVSPDGEAITAASDGRVRVWTLRR